MAKKRNCIQVNENSIKARLRSHGVNLTHANEKNKIRKIINKTKKFQFSVRQLNALKEIFSKYEDLTEEQYNALSLVINLSVEKIKEWNDNNKITKLKKLVNITNNEKSRVDVVSKEFSVLMKPETITNELDREIDSDQVFDPPIISSNMISKFNIHRSASRANLVRTSSICSTTSITSSSLDDLQVGLGLDENTITTKLNIDQHTLNMMISEIAKGNFYETQTVLKYDRFLDDDDDNDYDNDDNNSDMNLLIDMNEEI